MADGLLPQLYAPGWSQAVRFDAPDGTEWKAIRTDRQAVMLWNLSANVSEGPNLATLFPTVVTQAESYMDEAHTESVQWPSTTSATQWCCDHCYSAKGCNGTKNRCPAPAPVSSANRLATAVTTPTLPPAVNPDDLANVFDAGQGLQFTVTVDSLSGEVKAVHSHARSARSARHGALCLSSASGVLSACQPASNCTLELELEYGEQLGSALGTDAAAGCLAPASAPQATPARAVVWLEPVTIIVDLDYKYVEYKLHISWESSFWQDWTAPFRPGKRWLVAGG